MQHTYIWDVMQNGSYVDIKLDYAGNRALDHGLPVEVVVALRDRLVDMDLTLKSVPLDVRRYLSGGEVIEVIVNDDQVVASQQADGS